VSIYIYLNIGFCLLLPFLFSFSFLFFWFCVLGLVILWFLHSSVWAFKLKLFHHHLFLLFRTSFFLKVFVGDLWQASCALELSVYFLRRNGQSKSNISLSVSSFFLGFLDHFLQYIDLWFLSYVYFCILGLFLRWDSTRSSSFQHREQMVFLIAYW